MLRGSVCVNNKDPIFGRRMKVLRLSRLREEQRLNLSNQDTSLGDDGEQNIVSRSMNALSIELASSDDSVNNQL